MHRYKIYYRPKGMALMLLQCDAYTAADALVAVKVKLDAEYPSGYALERLECQHDLEERTLA